MNKDVLEFENTLTITQVAHTHTPFFSSLLLRLLCHASSSSRSFRLRLSLSSSLALSPSHFFCLISSHSLSVPFLLTPSPSLSPFFSLPLCPFFSLSFVSFFSLLRPFLLTPFLSHFGSFLCLPFLLTPSLPLSSRPSAPLLLTPSLLLSSRPSTPFF